MGSSFSPGGAVGFLRTVVGAIRDENVSFMAASIAYYAFVSLVPLGALLVLSLAFVGDGALVERALALVGTTVSPAISQFLERNVVKGVVSGAVGASLVGGLTLLWGALRLFRGLNTAFSEIYDTTGDAGFVGGVVDALVALVTVPLALVVVIGTTALLSVTAVRHTPFVEPLALVGALVVVFLPLYYVFPDTDLTLREVAPGVVIAAVGWLGLQQLFQAYIYLTGASTGTAIGAVVLFLTWLYFAGGLILVGVVVNAVYGGYYRPESNREADAGS